jgi:hypothetical protein
MQMVFLNRLMARRTPLATTFMALALVAVLAAGLPQTANAQGAVKLSPKVGTPLKAGLDAAAKGRFQEAIAKLKEADAVSGKTAVEQQQINEAFCSVYLRARSFNNAAAACEKGLNSGALSGSAANERLKTLAQIYFQTQPRDLKKTVDYANRYLQATGGKDTSMHFLIGQAYYLAKNYKASVASMNQAVKLAEAAGRPVEENWLRYLLDSYTKLNDVEGVTRTTTQLVRLYPSKDNWRRLTNNLRRQVSNDDNLSLQVYRLMHELELMDQASVYTEAAIVGIQTGAPGDALRFMERGFSTKVLENNELARNQRILADAKRRAEEQQKNLPALEQQASAAAKGDADIRVAEAYLAYGNPDKALAAAERGIKKGVDNPDAAYLALGRAYLAKGNGAEARKAFQQVKGQDAAAIARLWTIRAAQS